MSAAYFCHISFPCCSGARVTFHILFLWLRVTILSAALVVAVPALHFTFYSPPLEGCPPGRGGCPLEEWNSLNVSSLSR